MLAEFVRDRSFFMRWGGGGGMQKKKGFRGGPPQKIKEKGGGHVKCFGKTLKWRNVLINEVLEESRRKGKVK